MAFGTTSISLYLEVLDNDFFLASFTYILHMEVYVHAIVRYCYTVQLNVSRLNLVSLLGIPLEGWLAARNEVC